MLWPYFKSISWLSAIGFELLSTAALIFLPKSILGSGFFCREDIAPSVDGDFTGSGCGIVSAFSRL
jgi:hypothetical protein